VGVGGLRSHQKARSALRERATGKKISENGGDQGPVNWRKFAKGSWKRYLGGGKKSSRQRKTSGGNDRCKKTGKEDGSRGGPLRSKGGRRSRVTTSDGWYRGNRDLESLRGFVKENRKGEQRMKGSHL